MLVCISSDCGDALQCVCMGTTAHYWKNSTVAKQGLFIQSSSRLCLVKTLIISIQCSMLEIECQISPIIFVRFCWCHHLLLTANLPNSFVEALIGRSGFIATQISASFFEKEQSWQQVRDSIRSFMKVISSIAIALSMDLESLK